MDHRLVRDAGWTDTPAPPSAARQRLPRPLSYPLTAIISDLHGNRPALEVVLADAAERKVERIVCLGDVVGYGGSPVWCLERVIELCSQDAKDALGRKLQPGFCLLGNHEQALLVTAEDFNPRARIAIEWTRGAVDGGTDGRGAGAADLWNFLGGLSSSHRDEAAMFVHGSPRDPVREYVLPSDIRRPDKMQGLFEHTSRPVCFLGHSHVGAVYYEDQRFFRPTGTEGPFQIGASMENRCLINVGSVGQPRDSDPRCGYAVFDGRHVTFVRLEYDISAAQADIRAIPALPSSLAERLSVGR